MIYITTDYAVLAVTDSGARYWCDTVEEAREYGGFYDDVIPQYIAYSSEDVTDLDMFI